MVSLIPPFQGDGILRQIGKKLGVVTDDITPVLHCQAARFDVAIDFQQELEIDPTRSLLFAQRLAVPLPEIEGFVTVHVDQSAGEIRQ
ncbi:hypothetical protein ES707_11073 [subsurface metagenome]